MAMHHLKHQSMGKKELWESRPDRLLLPLNWIF
jgi:hypothetical protein